MPLNKEHNMDLRDKVREEVREAIKKKIAGEHEQLDEGFGSAIVKGAATFFAGSVGAGIGYTTGKIAGIGVLGLLAGLGMLTPADFVAVPVGLALSGALAGLYSGSMIGLKTARNVTQKDSEKLIIKLVEVTKRRDEIITKLSGNEEEDKKYQTALDKFTREQMNLATKLKKELDWDFKNNLISRAELEFGQKIVKQAEDGKLTYIQK